MEVKKVVGAATVGLMVYLPISTCTVLHDRGRFDQSMLGKSGDALGVFGLLIGSVGADVVKAANGAVEDFGPYKAISDSGFAVAIRHENAAAHEAIDKYIPSYLEKDQPWNKTSPTTLPFISPRVKEEPATHAKSNLRSNIFTNQIIEAGSSEMRCKTGEVINKVHTDKKVVALTIDDGPSSSTTSEVLDVLHDTNSVATFFFLGDRITSDSGRRLVHRALEAKNEVGVHSYSHHLHNGDANAIEQPKAEEAFRDVLGKVPYAYRAPAYNYTPKLRQVIKKSGECFIGLSTHGDSLDWKSDLHPIDQAVKEIRTHDNDVIKNLFAGEIILVHDQMQDLPSDGGRNRPRTTGPEHIRYLINKIHAKGFRLVTVNELLGSSIK